MRVLLVEDDEYKQNKIAVVLTSVLPNCEIVVAKSVRDAVACMQGKNFDHVILDIALPSHGKLPGRGAGLPMPAGGIEILLEISYQSRPDPVTILTQYPEIEFDGKFVELRRARQLLMRSIKANIVDIIHFEKDNDIWKEKLRKAVGSIG